MRSGRGKFTAVSICASVCGQVSSENAIASAPAARPHRRARGGRKMKSRAGNHFMLAASAHSAPPRRGPVNCAAQTAMARKSVTLSVSSVTVIGAARIAAALAGPAAGGGGAPRPAPASDATAPHQRPGQGTPVYTPRMAEGHVIVIGGAEDKVRERVILNRFIALAGGPDARVAVISTASALGTAAGELYRRVFTELGCREVRSVHAMPRAQANDDSGARVVREATGIFLTGGNQLRLSATIGGTRLAQAILERHRQGAVVAGTSAGASAMSSHMVAFGASGGSPRQRMAQMAAGLGVLPGVIVDQHFQQRNRLGRLLGIIAPKPSLLGIGVGEDTAGVVGPDQVLEVIGRRSGTIIDGSGGGPGPRGGA